MLQDIELPAIKNTPEEGFMSSSWHESWLQTWVHDSNFQRRWRYINLKRSVTDMDNLGLCFRVIHDILAMR
jgi:hypothetical protein